MSDDWMVERQRFRLSACAICFRPHSSSMAERTAGAKMDDASVTAQVKTALLTHRSTSSVSTKVTTRDGTVTLTGIANNAAEKSLVTKLVSDIQGVTNVKNEMTVEVPKTK